MQTHWHAIPIPSMEDVEHERQRLKTRNRKFAVTRTAIYALILAAAVAVLIATLVLPVLKVSGTSMEPTLDDGEVIVLIKGSGIKTGDIVAFYYQNKLLLKRVIGTPGDFIDIMEDGTVTLNGQELDEPYVSSLSLGECDISLPYQVPEGKYFVMGDNREVSVDSRSSVVGCIEKDQIVGKVFFRVWPFGRFGTVHSYHKYFAES